MNEKDWYKRCTLLFIASVLLTVGTDLYSQTKPSDKLSIYYRVNESRIDPTYKDNHQTLSKIVSVFDGSNLPFIKSVSIEAYASPEGPLTFNHQLSWERAISLKQYILKKSPQAKDKEIEVIGRGENWQGLRELVALDNRMPQKVRVLQLIDSLMKVNQTIPGTSIKQPLKAIGTNVWTYIAANILPKLRVEALITVYVDSEAPEERLKAIKFSLDGINGTTLIRIPTQKSEAFNGEKSRTGDKSSGTVDHDLGTTGENSKAVDESPVTVGENLNTVVEEFTRIRGQEQFSRPKNKRSQKQALLALKTNLLFDLLTGLNIELEIPLGNYWSIAGEWTFPWWTIDNSKANSSRHRLQLLHGNLDLKYWLGNRAHRPQLDGYFWGLYGGMGKYDLEYSKKGVQGEINIEAGISMGMAHRIGKHFFMEYAFGLGYLKTDYRQYRTKWGADQKWHPIYTRGGDYHWIGPTRFKVSLGWIIDWNRNDYKK